MTMQDYNNEAKDIDQEQNTIVYHLGALAGRLQSKPRGGRDE